MTTLQQRGDELLAEVWGQIQAANRKRELEAIKANPEKHRLTRIMAAGASTNFTYWRASVQRLSKKLEHRIRFCVAHHRNAAGYFLQWREIQKYKLIKGRWDWFETERVEFQYSDSKKELRELAARKAAKDKLDWAHECAAKLPSAPQEAVDMLAKAIG